MNTEKAIDQILEKYEEFTDAIIGLSFLRTPFIDDFREFVGLKDDSDFVDAFETFMKTAHDTFRWNNYLEARTTAENTFRLFFERQRYPSDKLADALNGFIVSFFNQNIDEYVYEWEDGHPGEEYSRPDSTEDGIDTLYFARVLACVSDITDFDENTVFCRSIGVRYDYEQLHMCVWFSSQITKGSGQYSRDEINYSARKTYNRLLNPDSLLWIATVLGADKTELKAAAEEMKSKKTNAAKCGAVRKHVPFDTILQLCQKLMPAGDEK